MLTATFFEISADNINTMIGYGRSLIADFLPILLVLLGVGIAIKIIQAIFSR